MIRPKSPASRLALLLAAGVFAAAVPATAQTPTPAPTPAAAPPNPNALHWTSSVTAGLAWTAATTDSTSVNLSGGVTGVSERRTYDLQATHAYYKVEGPSFSQVGVDNQNVAATFRQTLSKHTYLAIRPSYKRDAVQKVDYVFQELVGLGFWAGGPRGRIDFIPVVGLVQQEKNLPAVDGNSATAGIYQLAAAKLNANWSLSQSFLFLNNFNDGDDYRMQAMAALTGKIAGPLGLQLSYTADHENLVVAGSDSTSQSVSVGLQLQFPVRK